jgi:hypothetical protein
MIQRVPVLVAAMLTVTMAIPFSFAQADPIIITAGSVVVSNPLGGAAGHLHGTEGFVADPIFFGSVNGDFRCLPCGEPGMTLSLAGVMDTVDGGGTVEVLGRSFPAGSIGGIPNTAYLRLEFVTGSGMLPPMAAGAVLSIPFHLEHSDLTVFDAEGFPASLALKGHGTATIELIPNRFHSNLWEFGRLRYDFQPVPEPATLLLIGTGMAASLVRRRRRSKPLRPPIVGLNAKMH